MGYPATALKSVDLPLPVAAKLGGELAAAAQAFEGLGGFEHHGFGETVAAVVQRVVEARDGPCEG